MKTIINARDFDKRIKIQGTDHDRHRKVTSEMRSVMLQLHSMGKNYAEIGRMFNVKGTTVRYNLDNNYRKNVIKTNSGAHTGTDYVDFDDRVAYKLRVVEKMANEKRI